MIEENYNYRTSQTLLRNQFPGKWFMAGYNEMLRRIEPEKIICYNTPFPEMQGDIVYVDYERSSWNGNVKKCAVGKYPKSEKLGSAGQAACCACTHSRYFTGGSPSGLRV